MCCRVWRPRAPTAQVLALGAQKLAPEFRASLGNQVDPRLRVLQFNSDLIAVFGVVIGDRIVRILTCDPFK